jgi:hypothetical protein
MPARWAASLQAFQTTLVSMGVSRSLRPLHILAALRFLDERGQLTAAGKDELTHGDEEIALLSEHVKVGARAFLDQSYEAYLTALQGYDQPPTQQVLEAGWDDYTSKYDLSKRPQANAYQQLLLEHAYDQTADALLRALDGVPDLDARLRGALADATATDRALIEAVLTVRETDAFGVHVSSNIASARIKLMFDRP